MNANPDDHRTPRPQADAPDTVDDDPGPRSMLEDLAAEVPAYRARLARPSQQPRARQDSDHPALQPRASSRVARAGTSSPAARRPPRPSQAQGLLRLAVHRLTDRDLWLLDMLLEHRIMTSEQIAQLAFGTHRRATARLAVLHQLGLLDRFRPYTDQGSAPMHYLLAPAGANLLAATANTTVAALDYRPERLARLAVSLQLAHDIGANGIFTALAHHARTNPSGPGSQLRVWWSARRCLAAWHGLIRPDGYGRWRGPARTPSSQPGRAPMTVEVDFFLEYDTGSEQLSRLTAKLDGYAQLAAASGLPTLVLFWLPSVTRELHLHQAVAAWQQTRRGRPGLPIATAVPYAMTPASPVSSVGSRGGRTGPSWAGPGDAVWLPINTTTSAPSGRLAAGARLTLADLACLQQPPATTAPSEDPESWAPAGDRAAATEAARFAPNPSPPARRPTGRASEESPQASPRTQRGAH